MLEIRQIILGFSMICDTRFQDPNLDVCLSERGSIPSGSVNGPFSRSRSLTSESLQGWYFLLLISMVVLRTSSSWRVRLDGPEITGVELDLISNDMRTKIT